MIKSLRYIIPLSLVLLTACSTKKNTAGSRFYHSFTTRYNVYFNGSEAYKAGITAQEQGHKDDYTARLPMMIPEVEATRSAGQSDFDRAITKCEKAIQLHSIKRRPQVSPAKRKSERQKLYLKREEFNPFLRHAWLLMAGAQYRKGEFLEAAATYSYIARHYAAQREVAGEARIGLAQCYASLDWFYDAEDALARAQRDSLPRRLNGSLAAAQANLQLRRGNLSEAAPLLLRTARRERSKLQRARLYFLLGQVERTLGHDAQADYALRKCLRQSPPYPLAFNARMLQTEVLSSGSNAGRMLKRLRAMARSANNKEYLDQVYYAMGNIYLHQRDTTAAVRAYERGRSECKRQGAERGVLLLRLAELYWQRGAYDLAQGAYSEAVGLLPKTHEHYEQATLRSRVLDELVPYTQAIHLQDSLLQLSTLSEVERNAAIDRTIKLLRAKEKAEARNRADSLTEARRNEAGGESYAGQTTAANNTTAAMQQRGAWYFYNPMTVQQGREAFIRQWGKRKNEDNWRRANRTVLAMASDEDYDYAAEDSLEAARASADSLSLAKGEEQASADSVATDPHTREYYLAQIPFTPEAKAAAHEVIQEGLYQAGLIEKDKLEDFPLADRTLARLIREYPQFAQREDALYQQFLLHSRTGNAAQAAHYRDLLAAEYPESHTTRLILSPDFAYNALHGRAIEDSLYTATYAAYRAGRNDEVARGVARSTETFPKGANRPKFLLVSVLSQLKTAPTDSLVKALHALVEEYSESDVSRMAGVLAKGLASGRKLGSGTYDLGALWSRRTALADAATDEAGRMREFTAERNAPFVCLIAYPTDSIAESALIYEMARFNFTEFLQRNFTLEPLRAADLSQLRIGGFTSYDEARLYASRLYADLKLAALLRPARTLLISESNLELLGINYSYDDYAAFYTRTFAPLITNRDLPLDEADDVPAQRYEDELTPEELERLRQGENKDDPAAGSNDDGEWYDN